MRTCWMYGSSFSDAVSAEVSRESDLVESITDLALPVLMQMYIPRIDLTTAQSRVVLGPKVARGSSGKMR